MKVIYVNNETGKEVHYGESITFHEEGTYGDYEWESTSTLPIVNETIPTLIEKGILVQKEVKEDKVEESKEKLTVEKRLDLLEAAVSMLIEQFNDLIEDCYEEDDEEDNN